MGPPSSGHRSGPRAYRRKEEVPATLLLKFQLFLRYGLGEKRSQSFGFKTLQCRFSQLRRPLRPCDLPLDSARREEHFGTSHRRPDRRFRRSVTVHRRHFCQIPAKRQRFTGKGGWFRDPHSKSFSLMYSFVNFDKVYETQICEKLHSFHVSRKT